MFFVSIKRTSSETLGITSATSLYYSSLISLSSCL